MDFQEAETWAEICEILLRALADRGVLDCAAASPSGIVRTHSPPHFQRLPHLFAVGSPPRPFRNWTFGRCRVCSTSASPLFADPGAAYRASPLISHPGCSAQPPHKGDVPASNSNSLQDSGNLGRCPERQTRKSTAEP